MCKYKNKPLKKALKSYRGEIERLFNYNGLSESPVATLAAKLDVLEVARKEVAASVATEINKPFDSLRIAFE